MEGVLTDEEATEGMKELTDMFDKLYEATEASKVFKIALKGINQYISASNCIGCHIKLI